MGFLRRLMGGGDDATAPDWARPMSFKDAVTFEQAVVRHLQSRSLRHSIGDGQLQLERNGVWSTYGLTNLAQLCHQVPRSDWDATVTRHFDNLFAATDAADEVAEIAGDFERVRSMLKVRLYPGPRLGGMDPRPPASWEMADGLVAALVFDLPTTINTATPEQVTAWGVERDELLAIARENLLADPVELEPIAESGPSAVLACIADHFFAASRMFFFSEMLPPAARGNAVFIAPHRHALLYAPVVDLGVVQSITPLISLGRSMFEEGPGSISPDLYWWRDGSVTLLPVEADGQQTKFFPPEEFVQVLNGLEPPR